MTLENFTNVLEIFPEEWFESKENKSHPLYILNERKNYHKEYFEIFDKNLKLLKENDLISKDLKTKLMNPPQFEDTLIEVKVATFLLGNEIDIDLPKTFPDIVISDMNTIIEVKNLHTLDKLLNSTGGYAIEIDEIKRMWDIISDEILPKLKDNAINLVLMNAPDVSFDEFKDLFVYFKRSREGGVKIPIDLTKLQPIFPFRGEFSKKENKDISAVIRMRDNHFRGIINPLNKKNIPYELRNLFNLLEIKIKK